MILIQTLSSILVLMLTFAWILLLMIPMIPFMLLAMPYTMYKTLQGYTYIPEHWSTIPYLRVHAFMVKYGTGGTQKNSPIA